MHTVHVKSYGNTHTVDMQYVHNYVHASNNILLFTAT